MKSERAIDRRHSMQEFGTVYGVTQEVRINRLEDRIQPLVPFPHRHDFYHLVVVTSGSGWHEIDFHRILVKPFQIFFMKPGQVHAWNLSPNVSGFVLEFGSDALLEKTRCAKIPYHIDFSRASKNSRRGLLELLQLMHKEYEDRGTEFEISLRYYLMPMLIDLYRFAKKENLPKENSDPLLEQFERLIEEHFRKEHRVDFYAKLLKNTPKALTMRVSRAFGKSARALIQERCLLEGKRLLAYSNLSISEIGYEIGFDDPNYFSRFFKIATRLSPGEFRNRAKR